MSPLGSEGFSLTSGCIQDGIEVSTSKNLESLRGLGVLEAEVLP